MCKINVTWPKVYFLYPYTVTISCWGLFIIIWNHTSDKLLYITITCYYTSFCQYLNIDKWQYWKWQYWFILLLFCEQLLSVMYPWQQMAPLCPLPVFPGAPPLWSGSACRAWTESVWAGRDPASQWKGGGGVEGRAGTSHCPGNQIRSPVD